MKYQQIKIGGVNIEGSDRSREYEWIFREGAYGKSILDIGCYLGYYIIRASQEGALRCVGIDIMLDIFCEDMWTWEWYEKFDVVLCLNVLHHLGDARRADALLDKINEWSDDRMVFIVKPPSGNVMCCRRTGKNNTTKLDIALEFFRRKWPGYDIVSVPGFSHSNRIIVDIRK